MIDYNIAKLDEIARSTNRLPYSASDMKAVYMWLEKVNKHGLDVRFHPRFSSCESQFEADPEGLAEGVFVIQCRQIETDFLFVKVSDGRGILGGQKIRFLSFLGDAQSDEYKPASSSKHILMAVTGINNIFRHVGLVSGPVF